MLEIRNNYNPDVLNCLANLSSDEVFTPPEVANQVLDLLPSEIWFSSSTTFLDPACKSGVFLREIAKRLISGLAEEIPDLQERINHIFSKQLFAISITELTALLSRRSAYCSKHANGEYSICQTFENESGNIIYNRTPHTWKNEKCIFCGASKKAYERSEDLESHAYQFIHTKNPEEIFNMKFDVIVGNPPYQLSDAGESTGSSPIYHLFIEQAKKLNPRYLSMIIPSRWFAGGKGLDGFRDQMLRDNKISHLVDFPIASDVFPGVRVIGGICYFLRDSNYEGDCQVTTNLNGAADTLKRPLNQYDTFVRFNKAISILEKVKSKSPENISGIVSRQKPFGLRTFARPSGKGDITLYANKTSGPIEESEITSGKAMLDKWKIFLSMAYGEGGEAREYPRRIMGKPIVAAPNSACTETYIVIGTYEDELSAESMKSYLQTKFVRFLVGLRKNTQHITQDRFKFVPKIPMNRKWTDEDLYQYFQLEEEEIQFIESMIRPME